jgi:hypothetical protein
MSRIARAALGAAAIAAIAVPYAGARTASTPCTGSMLGGSFKVIPGSAGAGNIVYRLRVANTGSSTCFVTGIPGLTLLDKQGRKLPTKATFGGRPGTLTAVMVPLSPGTSASLTARFSPDIPGPGEPALMRACEPTAYTLRVAPSGGGATVVPISPPTPVCEHGGMSITGFTAT